jgi:hypothetical protein
VLHAGQRQRWVRLIFHHIGGMQMSVEAKCSFQITSWDEKTYEDIGGGAKLSNVKVTQSYSGAIEGTSSIEYLMSYTAQGTANFVGLERVTGTVAGRTGAFVLQHVGGFADGKARSAWTVVVGSGTEGLASLHGDGSYVAGHGEPAQASFKYWFAPNA